MTNYITRLLISFSGGRTSAFMTLKLLEAVKTKTGPEEFELLHPDGILIAFANTGMEHPGTIAFIRKFDAYIGEKFGQKVHIVEYGGPPYNPGKSKYCFRKKDFGSMSMDGMPALSVAERYGIWNPKFPHCTREMKQTPLHQFGQLTLGDNYTRAIGFRIDEPERATVAKGWFYPLISIWPTTKEEVNAFWQTMPFDLEIPDRLGNCIFCFKKSWTKLIQNAREFPEELELMARLERNYGKGQYTFFRMNKSVQDLKDEATGGDETEESCLCGDGLALETFVNLQNGVQS